MSAKKKKAPAQDSNPVGCDAKVTRMPALPGRGAQPAHVRRERQRRSVFTGSMRPSERSSSTTMSTPMNRCWPKWLPGERPATGPLGTT
jgi:hypothetical protein